MAFAPGQFDAIDPAHLDKDVASEILSNGGVNAAPPRFKPRPCAAGIALCYVAEGCGLPAATDYS